MNIADTLIFQGSCGVCIWGFSVSISGITSCGCTTDEAAGGVAYGIGSAKLTTLADLSAIPTLPIDGTCFDATNSAVWLPTSGTVHGEGDTGCYYALEDPYLEFAGTGSSVGTNSALAIAQYYGNLNTNCAGTPIGYCYGLQGFSRFYWSGTNQMIEIGLSVAPGNFEGNPVGPFPIFHSTGIANCLFSYDPASFSYSNQLSCGTKFDSTYVIASGGNATVTPITVDNRVVWGCRGVNYPPITTNSAGTCPPPNNDQHHFMAVPCYGQCMGTNEGSFDMAAGTTEMSGLQRVIHGAGGLAKAALGIDRADEATIRRRREICAGCEHNIGKLLRRCALCGCGLRAKTALSAEKCPAGKW